MKTEKDIFCRAARSVYAFGVRGFVVWPFIIEPFYS
jgi:hypothetical protein